jgi:hypothetical protein
MIVLGNKHEIRGDCVHGLKDVRKETEREIIETCDVWTLLGGTENFDNALYVHLLGLFALGVLI